ncbi:hypothetical protein [Streptomyces sp. NPDC002547]
MSAPVSRDPLLVRTQDGSSWVRRAVTKDGRGLYALEGTQGCCPEYVLTSLAELAELGLALMRDGQPEPTSAEPQRCVEDELTGARLALWEEEQDNARLRLAWQSARCRAWELREQIAELKEQRERRRLRLIAYQNDAISMRGSLAPNGEDRKVPFPLGETLTPAVDWLIGRVAELERLLDAKDRPVDEDPILFELTPAADAEDPCHPCGCPKRFDRHADWCPEAEQEAVRRSVDAQFPVVAAFLADEEAAE